jgi:hypothetical protein
MRIRMVHRTASRTFAVRRAAAGACCVLLAACGGRGEEPAFTARDSAGVHIAESRRPAWAPGEEWTVGAQPAADVAVGREPFLATRLADGRIAVADEWSVTLFGPRGERTGTVLRPASWPSGIDWIGTAGDSLLVWQPRRLSVYTPAGTLGREVRPEGTQYLAPRMVGRLADGTLLLTAGHQEPVAPGPPRRGLVAYLWTRPDGTPLGRFADFADVQRVYVDGVGAFEVPFSTRTLVTLIGDEVLVAETGTFELAVLARDGTLRRVLRRPWEPLAVDRGDVEAHHAALDPRDAAANPETYAMLQRMRQARRERIPHEPVFPAFTRLLTGPDASVWAEEPRHSYDLAPRWSVFAPDGRWLGTVAMPGQLTLQQVGDGWVLGSEPDGDGVLHARVYPLVRPAGGRAP